MVLKTVPSECAAQGPVKDVLDFAYVHLPTQEFWVPIFIRVAPEQLLLVFRKLDKALPLGLVAEMIFYSRQAVTQEIEGPGQSMLDVTG